MQERSIRALDLNLLVTLNALLEERSVTRAAERVGVSQPAASAALGRLRRYFGDELLKRSGGKEQLAHPAGCRAAPTDGGGPRERDAGVRRGQRLRPRARRSRVHADDVRLRGHRHRPPLTALVAAQAPGVRLRLEQMEPFAAAHAYEVLRSVDGLFLPYGMISDLPAVDLFEETWVAIVADDDPTVGDALTLEQAASLSWVTSVHGREGSTPAVQQLRAAGVEPRVVVVVDGFSAIPFLVADTDRVALLPSRLARLLADVARVKVVPCGWPVVPMRGRRCGGTRSGDPTRPTAGAGIVADAARTVGSAPGVA